MQVLQVSTETAGFTCAVNLVNLKFADPRIMKVLLGLLGYSCKIHRKRSKSSLNRFSFSESDEHRVERSFSSEEHKLGNDAENAHSKIHSSLSEPSTSTSAQSERNTEEKSALLTRDQKGKPEDKQADETKGIGIHHD